jgi:tryptophan synthase alpha chain
MQLLENTFTRCRSANRSAFIPFVTAGDPSLEQTAAVIDALVTGGADAIEIGFPYSDPLADGPVIQASYTRSLAAGTKLAGIFAAAKQWTSKYSQVPFLAMVSYSLVYRQGPANFIKSAVAAGFQGLIIPDLPLEEAEKLAPQAAAQKLAIIQLVTPTTPLERAKKIAATTTGFLYVVSVTGITGTRTSLPAELTQQLAQLRQLTKLPLCVGFGISTAEQAKMLAGAADGIIVGSAIVRCLEGNASLSEKLKTMSTLASQLASSTHAK